MFTGNREFNEIYEKYKNLVLKVAYIYSGNNYDGQLHGYIRSPRMQR